MPVASLSTANRFFLEDWRIRRHLRRVEQRLRACQIDGLTDAQRAARARSLEYLHEYWVQGRFPRNTDHLYLRLPCFIDHEGRTCAVADLVIRSGHADLARRVDEVAHNARVRAMRVDGLGAWVDESGLTLDELAMIQPGYDPPSILMLVDIVYVPILLVASIVNALLALFNRRVREKQRGWRLIVPALVGAAAAVAALIVMGTVAPFGVGMVLHFLGIASFTDMYGETTMITPEMRAQMALPLLIFVVALLVTLVIGAWSLISGGRNLIAVLRRSSPPPDE